MKKKILAIILTAAVLAVSGCTENGTAAGNNNTETVTEHASAAVDEKSEPVIYEFENGDAAYLYFDDEPVPGCCG